MTYTIYHYLSVTHEWLTAFKVSSKLVLGRRPLDQQGGGVEVDLLVGDIQVVQAGVGHCSLSSDNECEYLGLYSEVSSLGTFYTGCWLVPGGPTVE